MAVTSTPIFAQTPNTGSLNAILSTAMTNTKAFDGTETAGTALALIFTAGADGSRIDQVMCRLASTNGATYRIYAGTTVAAGGTNIAIAVSAFGGNY